MQPNIVKQKRIPIKLNQRVPFMVEVSCATDVPAGTRQYLAMNLGKGGIFLKTLLPLETGTLLRCSFRIPDGEGPIVANAKVVWTRRGAEARDAPAGMGIRFINLTKQEQTRLRAYISECDFE
ncbi:MAG: TIGR02266 family protein [bacterium]